MGDTTTITTAPASSSRLGIRSITSNHHSGSSNNNFVIGGGEIVEVQGGHIVRSTGRKDRHSKVCTAKGPRDRRVRLAAHTAIQFYDVQDRLGYDRPSKAVDWLIKKAKAAIDELDELPTWNPISSAAAAAAQSATAATTVSASLAGDGGLNLQSQMMEQQHQQNDNSNNNNNGNTSSGFLPPSLDSDAIADTIKSFFPIASEEQQHHNHNQDHHSHHPRVSSSSSIQFYAPDLLSRTSTGQSQDLQLSLQSFQDPILLNHHQQQAQAQQAHHNEHGFFSGFGWSDHHHHQNPAEISRFQRIMFNNNGGNNGGGGGGGGGGGDGGFVFNSPPLLSRGGENNNNHHHHNNNNNNQFFSFQRGPLQSSNTPSVRAWIDHTSSSSSSSPLMVMSSIADHQIPHSLSGMGFIPSVGGGGGGFSSGFHHNIPARIQGEEEHDGISDKPSSASSDSCH